MPAVVTAARRRQSEVMDLTTQLGDQLDAAALANPRGPAEGPYAEYPMSTLVLHINREVIHHGAEIACIRDFYVHSQ